MCQRKTADKHALQAFKETCDEAATELPPGWKNAFQLFCADSSETTSHGARWAAFKADNGGTGGEYDEMARVARLEYLQAHAEEWSDSTPRQLLSPRGSARSSYATPTPVAVAVVAVAMVEVAVWAM